MRECALFLPLPCGFDHFCGAGRGGEPPFLWGMASIPEVQQLSKGRCQKKRIYLGLCPKLWVGGSRSRSKVPNFLVKISIQLFLLQTSRNVLKHVIHKWGGHIWPFHDALRPQRFWNFGILSEKFLIFSKK